MADKKRKYYKTNNDGIALNQNKEFLLKWISHKDGSVMQEGPYSNEKDANDLLSKYLKNGICSWLVTYND